MNRHKPDLKDFYFNIKDLGSVGFINIFLACIYNFLKPLEPSISYRFSFVIPTKPSPQIFKLSQFSRELLPNPIRLHDFIPKILYRKNYKNYDVFYSLIKPCIPLLFVSKNGIFTEQRRLTENVSKQILLLAVRPNNYDYQLSQKFLSNLIDIINYCIQNRGTDKMKALDMNARPDLLFSIFNKGLSAVKQQNDASHASLEFKHAS